MAKKIQIIGSGWLAQPLAKQLIQDGYTVSLSSRDADKCEQLTASGLNTQLFDITSKSPNYQAVLDCNLLIIAITCKDLVAFQGFAEAIAASNIEHVLYISSTSVYRSTNDVVVEDQEHENPDSIIYQVEQTLSAVTPIPLTRLRFSGLIGPKRHPGRFFRGGKSIKQPDAPVNLIHLDDCIGLIQAILNQPKSWGQAFNGSAASHPIKRVFYAHAFAQLGTELPPFADEPANAYKIVSNAKSKAVLQYEYKHDDVMLLSAEDYQ